MQDIEELLSKISDLASVDFSCMHECYDINSFKNHLDESSIDIYRMSTRKLRTFRFVK